MSVGVHGIRSIFSTVPMFQRVFASPCLCSTTGRKVRCSIGVGFASVCVVGEIGGAGCDRFRVKVTWVRVKVS